MIHVINVMAIENDSCRGYHIVNPSVRNDGLAEQQQSGKHIQTDT